MSWLTDRFKDVVHYTGMVEQVTGAKVLDPGLDNNKTFVWGAAAPGPITLPAVTNVGFKCKVVVGFGLTSDAVVSSAEGDNLEGALMVASTVVTVDAADNINFVDTAENLGDWVTFESDGAIWYVDGRALTTAAITATG
jgi:hypothetical protein